MSANGYYGQQSGDLHATLVISQNEAAYGTTRMLNLPDGRVIPITIPPGTGAGQEIRLEGQGHQITSGGPLGALILTVSIPTAENFGSQPYPYGGTDTPTEFIAPPPPPPVQASYSGGNQGANYTNYPAQGLVPPPYVNQQAHPTPPPYVPTVPYNGTQSQTPVFPPQPRPSRRPLLATITIGIIALFIILGSVLYYATVYQPQQQHVQATATAGAHTKSTSIAGTMIAGATNTAQAGATGTTSAQPLNDYMKITATTPDLLNDPLSSPSTNKWDTNANCTFKGNTYHVTETQSGFFYDCAAKATNFTHFLYQIKMTFLQGIYGGILFRSDPGNFKYYLLRFNRSTGQYNLYLYLDKQAKNAKTLLEGTSVAFKTDMKQANLIAVLVRGKTIMLYVNSTYVDAVNDGTFASGQIGVFAEDNQEAAEISFEQAQVWNA
ncbi:MAG: hypothetical protein PVSMB2_27430 [Ktedonobacteraceae bacterium]